MSDMQTALTKALEEGKRRFMTATLNDWEKHEQQIRQQVQPQPEPEKAMAYANQERNLTREIFQHIRNGACTPEEVINTMVGLGYKKVSAGSLITQMKRKGLVRLNDGYLVANYDEYVPLGSVYKKRKAEAKPAKASKAGIAALTAATAPAAPITAQWDADTVIANIGIKEAYKLYEELSKYFGKKG